MARHLAVVPDTADLAPVIPLPQHGITYTGAAHTALSLISMGHVTRLAGTATARAHMPEVRPSHLLTQQIGALDPAGLVEWRPVSEEITHIEVARLTPRGKAVLAQWDGSHSPEGDDAA